MALFCTAIKIDPSQVNGWSFTWVWVTTSLFRPISTILSSNRFWFFIRSPFFKPPFKEHQLQLVSTSAVPLYSIALFVIRQGPSICLYFYTISIIFTFLIFVYLQPAFLLFFFFFRSSTFSFVNMLTISLMSGKWKNWKFDLEGRGFSVSRLYLLCRFEYIAPRQGRLKIGMPTRPSIFGANSAWVSICAWLPTRKWLCAAFWLGGKSVKYLDSSFFFFCSGVGVLFSFVLFLVFCLLFFQIRGLFFCPFNFHYSFTTPNLFLFNLPSFLFFSSFPTPFRSRAYGIHL